jgi:hypothetical protein
MPKPIALSDLTRDSSDELLMLSTSDGCSKAPLKKDKQQEEQIFEDDGGDMAHFEGEKHLVEYPVGFSKKA